MNYLPTNRKATVENYPYGYTQRTTAYYSIEHKNGQGFRMVFQTVNPKTGLLNKPKKSTYSPLEVLTDTDGRISTHVEDFYGDDGFDKGIQFLAEHFDLFASEEIKSVAIYLIARLKSDIYAKATYCNSDVNKLLPLYDVAVKTLVEIAKTATNLFYIVKLDWTAIEALEEKGYNPFKTVTTTV